MAEGRLGDGLAVLGDQLPLPTLMRLIEATARWVAPETFRLLPVWYPEYRRGGLFFNADWTVPRQNRNRITGEARPKTEGNTYAGKALMAALGQAGRKPVNWSCCHLWGIDDDRFQSSNTVVQDARFYSCPANMVLLPTPLKAFTDAMPAVKAMLRRCADSLYGWSCDHADLGPAHVAADGIEDWSPWPASWPRERGAALPQGVIACSEPIKQAIDRRKAAIRRDLAEAGPHYPRDQVRDALDYWQMTL